MKTKKCRLLFLQNHVEASKLIKNSLKTFQFCTLAPSHDKNIVIPVM